jgi:valyl-tRNA synthetase
LIAEAWPLEEAARRAPAAAGEINWVIGLITAIRSMRTDLEVPAGDKIPCVSVSPDASSAARIRTHGEVIARLARLTEIETVDAAPKGAVEIVHEGAVFALPLTGAIDIAGAKKRLAKEIDKSVKDIDGIDKKFANPSFMERAPVEIVEESKERRLDADARRLKLTAALRNLEQA